MGGPWPSLKKGLPWPGHIWNDRWSFHEGCMCTGPKNKEALQLDGRRRVQEQRERGCGGPVLVVVRVCKRRRGRSSAALFWGVRLIRANQTMVESTLLF